MHLSKATHLCLSAVALWTGINILERSTLSFEMLKVCLHGRWGRVYSSSVWMSLSTRLPRMNNDGFVVTLTKKQFAYPTQPSQSKRTWRLCLPSQECFIRAHSHVPASVSSWPYSGLFCLVFFSFWKSNMSTGWILPSRKLIILHIIIYFLNLIYLEAWLEPTHSFTSFVFITSHKSCYILCLKDKVCLFRVDRKQ